MRRKLFLFKPFSALSRGKKRDLYVSLRWRIRQEAKKFGGTFLSDYVLEEPGRPRWFDQDYRCHALGSDGCTIWNIQIQTANRHFWDGVRDMAADQALSLLSDTEREDEFRLDFQPVRRGGKTYYALPERATRYAQFGDLTYGDYCAKSESEIIERSPPRVFESFRLDTGYRYGVGVHAVVDAPYLDRATVERTIRGFLSVGERDWTAKEPVPRAHLPTDTFEYLLANATEAERRYARFGVPINTERSRQ